MRHLIFLALLTALLSTACTRPPYSSQGKDLADVDADFTDCYTQASLTANTPPYPDSPLRAVDSKADDCMASRGYQKHFRIF